MLNVDTDRIRQYAVKFQNQMQNGFSFQNSLGFARHQQIQNGLASIADYLSQSASLYENNDWNLSNQRWNVQTSFHPNIYSFLTQRESGATARIRVSGSLKEKEWSASNEYSYAQLKLDLGKVKAEGKAEFSLWKDKQVSPKLELSASAVASVLSAEGYARIGTQNIYVDGRGQVTAGAVYANAKAVLGMDEQTLEIGIGVSALKGEVEGSFHLFGAKVTLTGQGSIGSAELNMSYHHSNREWEIGSKLGFIAGAGFKIKVEY